MTTKESLIDEIYLQEYQKAQLEDEKAYYEKRFDTALTFMDLDAAHKYQDQAEALEKEICRKENTIARLTTKLEALHK